VDFAGGAARLGSPLRASALSNRRKEVPMKQILYAILTTTAMAWSGTAFAQAMNCMDQIRKVDDALAKSAKMDPPRVDEVRKLRNEAEKLQSEGKSAECLATIERAKAMLSMK
jgi:hypothetical protein